MDGLSAAASVIAVLQISESVISVCRKHLKTAKGARKDIVNVITMVTALKGTLETIHDLLDGNDDAEDPSLQLLNSLEPSFTVCYEAMETIAKKLGIDAATDSIKDFKVNFIEKATWPWKEKEVDKVLQTLEKFVTIFILALNGDNAKIVRAVQEGVKDVTKALERMTISERHIGWLNVTHPFVNHKAARLKHEPTTGDWLLESDLLTAWQEAQRDSLWLYGKPGAGKTILCSTLIEHVKSLCTGDSTDHYAYFYFDFSDAQKQTFSNMLCSFVGQLSVALVSKGVDELYKSCNEGQRQPCADDLVKVLVALCHGSHRTYFIVDAMDECTERKQLLSFLRTIIQTELIQANVLATSRYIRKSEWSCCEISQPRLWRS